MFACIEGIHGDLEVRVERCGYDDAIDILVLQQLAVVGVGLGFGNDLQRLIERWLVDVGKGGDFALGVLSQKAEQESSARARAYHAKPASFASSFLGRCESREPGAGCSQGTSSHQSKIAKEISSVHC